MHGAYNIGGQAGGTEEVARNTVKRDTCENRVRIWFLISYSEPHSVLGGTALQYPKRQPCWPIPLLMSLLFTASTFSTTLQPLLSLFLYSSCPYSSRCLLYHHAPILPVPVLLPAPVLRTTAKCTSCTTVAQTFGNRSKQRIFSLYTYNQRLSNEFFKVSYL